MCIQPLISRFCEFELDLKVHFLKLLICFSSLPSTSLLFKLFEFFFSPTTTMFFSQESSPLTWHNKICQKPKAKIKQGRVLFTYMHNCIGQSLPFLKVSSSEIYILDTLANAGWWFWKHSLKQKLITLKGLSFFALLSLLFLFRFCSLL